MPQFNAPSLNHEDGVLASHQLVVVGHLLDASIDLGLRKRRVLLRRGEKSPHHMKLQRLCSVFLINAPSKQGHELLQSGLGYVDARRSGCLL